MRWNEIQDIPCSIARTLSVIGDRWTLLVIREAFLGVRRFEQFQKRLQITRHRLSDRLNKLVESGVLRKALYQESPARYEYRLTRKGMDLYPVILAMAGWGDKYMAGDAGPPVEYVHLGCGKKMTATLVCSECGEPIDAKSVKPMLGPGLSGLAKKVGE
ncbi:transcriptional regulator [Hahella sp. KA22]|uniref:winged helix-turn-helix transcriptional regulator n=1 Tax=Hahella sp. KA22 TaxID=1628392 RepID=UPI000FDD64FE|nr:helix-turn-helix domain-containing protein [Hahella sp. KA22]AZZ90298.1 transcriptional regulator [Hahella sp. KA22]QAY53668.1 transcriptional regulator [Hahella sp. KA22]